MTTLERRTRIMAVALGVASVMVAWAVPDEPLARWLQHPRRAGAAQAAMQAASWARIGWTMGGLVLASMPWVLLDRRTGLTSVTRVPTRTLWLAMLLASALRFSASTQGLWYDEIASLGTYVAHGPGAIVGNAFTTANHPLQSLLSWCCLPLGVEPWIRLPSMLSGAAAVLGCWLIGRAVREGAWLANAMALAMAVLPAAVNAGAEARGYGLMIASAALSTGLLVTAMRHGGSWRWIASAIVLALGVWAHFVTAMAGAGQALFALWLFRRKQDRVIAVGTLLTVACAALLAIALWSPALPDLLRTRTQFATHRGDEPTLAGAQGLLLLWQLVGMTPLPMHAAGVDVALAALSATLPAALMVIGAIEVARDARLRAGLALAGLGLPLAVAAAWLGGSWLYARFLLFAAPATVLLLAAGVQRATRLATRSPIAAKGGSCGESHRGASGLGILLAALVACTFLAYDLLAGPRQPIREAVALVASRREPSQRVLGIGIADDVVQWYAMAYDVPVEPTGLGGERLPESLARTDAAWIVAMYPDHRHANATERALSHLGFRRDPPHGLVGWLDGGQGTVEVWERDRRNP